VAILDGVAEVWKRIGLVQRVLLLGLLLACAGAVFLLVGWVRQPNYSLLYSALAPAEAAKIAEKVKESGTPYELRDGGASIYVPEEKVYSLRLTMAQAGLPAGDQPGYRILDEEKIGASPFSQHLNYTRALEGELARTIRLIDGVLFARVHVVCPERSALLRQEKEATATVALRLKPGCRFTSGNVAAVMHLVAGAVEGLSADRVVVVDSQGNVLAGDGRDSEFAKGAGTILDYKNRVEQYLGQKAEDMLAMVLGPNRSSVRVDVTLESTSSNHTTETYEPGNRVVTKEKISSTVTPGVSHGDSNSAPASGKEETTESTYVAGKTVEQKTAMPGTIKSMTVAAFVDLSSPSADGNGAGPALTIKDAEDIIRNAVGAISPDMVVKVVNVAFHKQTDAQDALKAGEAVGFWNKDFILDIAKRASLGILVVGVLVLLKVLGGGKKSATTALVPVGASAGGEMAAAGAGETDPERIRSRIARALQDNPEEVKRLFLSWVDTEKGEA
jgi:flagellar M-ring protein FliF